MSLDDLAQKNKPQQQQRPQRPAGGSGGGRGGRPGGVARTASGTGPGDRSGTRSPYSVSRSLRLAAVCQRGCTSLLLDPGATSALDGPSSSSGSRADIRRPLLPPPPVDNSARRPPRPTLPGSTTCLAAHAPTRAQARTRLALVEGTRPTDRPTGRQRGSESRTSTTRSSRSSSRSVCSSSTFEVGVLRSSSQLRLTDDFTSPLVLPRYRAEDLCPGRRARRQAQHHREALLLTSSCLANHIPTCPSWWASLAKSPMLPLANPVTARRASQRPTRLFAARHFEEAFSPDRP